MSSPRRIAVVVAALFVAALALRLHGLDWLLPQVAEPDVHLAVQLEAFRTDVEPAGWETHEAKYPHLIARVLQALPGLAADPGSTSVGEHLRAASGAILEVRALVALLSALLVPLTFLLARRFLAAPWALVAAALVAVGPLHQHLAQQARPHGASATLVLLGVLACMRLARRPTFVSALLAGVAAALAFASLHSGVALVLPLAAALWLGRRDGRPEVAPGVVRAVAATVPLAAALLVFYPFLLRGGGAEALDLGGGGLQQSAHSVAWSAFDGRGFLWVARSLWSFEPVVLVLALLGVAWFRSGRSAAAGEPEACDARDASGCRDLIVALAYALPYLVVIGLYSLTYQRFVLPLMPFIACCAAAGLARVTGCLTPRAGGVLVAAALLIPAAVTWRLAHLRAAPDTLEQAASWLEQHVGRDTPVLVAPGIDLPLARKPGVVRRDAALPHGIRPDPWIDYQAALLERAGDDAPLFAAGCEVFRAPLADRRDLNRLSRRPAEWLADTGAELFVVSLYDKKQSNLAAWLLREHGRDASELVARFSPERTAEYEHIPLAYHELPADDPLNFSLRMLRARAVGPTVEIYRIVD